MHVAIIRSLFLLLGFAPSLTCVATTLGAERSDVVPPQLLPLLHAPEVHHELKLSAKQVSDLESYFTENDGDWFRARIQPAEQQRKTIEELEQRLHSWLKANCSREQRERLMQLECQAQSVRMLCRPDVAKLLGLSEKQQQRFETLARQTIAAQAAQDAAMRQGAAEEERKRLSRAISEEQEAFKGELTPPQRERLRQHLGEIFPTEKLKRIYPMAPEWITGSRWLNSEPLRLQSLRGKVVLVHFYAFQCHNCHANFEIYKRWHRTLKDKGVIVVGIQSPETQAERKAEAIESAAKEKGLEFPILLDLESATWNAWANTMWPTVYVVDKQGYLRYWWQGELNWQGATGDKTIEELVDRLLAE